MSEPEPQNGELNLLAALLSVLLCTTFGANAVAVKLSLSGLGVFTTAGLRFSLAALAIALWCRASRHPLGLKRPQLRPMAIMAFSFSLQMALFYIGISRTHASRATLIVNLQPFIVLVLAHFFIPGDRMTLRKVLGLAFGFAGVVLVFLDRPSSATDLASGDLIILLAAFVWAARTVYIKRHIHLFAATQIVFFSVLSAAAIYLSAALIWDPRMIFDPSAKAIGGLLYQGLVTASLGFVAWTYLLQRYGAVALHSFIFVMPMAGVALGGLLLGEPMTPKLGIGLALLVAGLLIVHLGSRAGTWLATFLRGL